MAKPILRRMPTGFYRFQAWNRQRSDRKSAGLSVVWRSRPVLDQVAAGHRHMLDQRHRASLIKMPGRVLLVKGVLRRHAVDWHDRLEATLGRALGRARDRPLRRGAGDDHGADALILERRLQLGI